jgi:UMF1 family MFS transporter
MLPSLTTEAKLGRLSGYAWALGYVGGLLTLFIVLGAFTLPEVPLFGLDKAANEHDRIVGPLSAVWILIFILPLAFFTPDLDRTTLSKAKMVKIGLTELWATLRQVSHYRNMVLFLIARMIYFDGLTAIFAFGGIYAAGIFGWTTTNLGIFGIILTIMAAIGAFFGGWLDDRIGSKKTIIIAVVGLIIATVGVISVTTEDLGGGQRADTIFFAFTYTAQISEDAGMFTTPAEWVFLLFGMLIGICGGPAQAASRTLVSRLSPPELVGKFYGLYALSGKATAFIAPFTVAAITGIYDSQRAGISVIIVFLVVGLLLFLPVHEQRTDPPE